MYQRNPNAPCPPNNPHCQGLYPVGVPIDNIYFIGAMIIAGIILILITLKIINMRTLFNRVSIFLWGEKPFRWGELKGL